MVRLCYISHYQGDSVFSCPCLNTTFHLTMLAAGCGKIGDCTYIKPDAYQDLSWVHAANTHSLLLLRLLGVASSLLLALYGGLEKRLKDTKYSIA
jgi:hypothetical protein